MIFRDAIRTCFMWKDARSFFRFSEFDEIAKILCVRAMAYFLKMQGIRFLRLVLS